MRISKFPSPHLILTIGILFIVIAVFGTLQYRWTGEISAQEYERMRRNLRVAGMQYSVGFTAELASMLRALGTPLPADSLAREREVEERLKAWRASATDGKIVAGTNLVRTGEELLRAPFLPDPEDSVLIPDRGFFPSRPTRGSWLGRRALRVMLEPGLEAYLFADLTGFAVPVLPDGPAPATATRVFVVFAVDTARLKHVILPHLAETTLWSQDEHDYDYCVVSARSPREVFALSNPSRPISAFQQADAVVPFGFFPPFPLAMLPSRPLAGFREFPGPRDIDDHTARSRREASRGQPFSPPERGPDRPGFGGGDPRALEGPMRDAALFELRLRHRSGSLEEHVGWVRARNFGIGLGIVLVLGASVLVLTIGAERARRLARQQLTFVAGVSHELRTPLAVLKSAGENLADGVIQDPVRAREYGRLITREVGKLSGMVEQALGYAGIQSGLQRPAHCAVDIVHVILHAVTALENEAREAGLEVQTDFGDDLPTLVGDATALQVAVENLVGNAVKHGAEGRWIGVTCQRDTSSGNGVVIAVRDHGRGIPARELPRVFDPFYRGQRTAEEQVRGSGLGLTITRHIVESHGGSIRVDSGEGRGSVFIIRLPADARSAPS
jgi:signal transduction histidine kinase